jgi:PKD repeat protein
MLETRTTMIARAARGRLALLLCSLCGLWLATVAVTPARAVIVTLGSGSTLSYQPLRGAARPFSAGPFDAFFNNLDYNGGPVMPSNTNFTVYWRPEGFSTNYPAGYKEGVNRYLADLAHDSGGNQNVDSVSTQYNDAAGEFANYESHFGGELIDTHAYPANGCTRASTCLSDQQIREELVRFVAEQKLPTDLTHEYFLLTPPEVESCFEGGAASECSAGSTAPVFCAYHGNVPTEGGELIYSNDPFVTGIVGCDDGNHPNESPSDGALEGGLSHEHNESITDPEPNNAWTDFGGEIGENGDKCAGQMGEPLGKTETGKNFNQIVNGHDYWYQEEWSNQGHTCLQRLTFSGERPTATFTVTPGNGREVAFNAAGSTAPGGVFRFNWQFNAFGRPGVPAETSTPTVARVFPSNGTFTVALTVLAENGTSIGTAKTFSVTAPSAAFTVAPGSPTAGEAVSFDAGPSKANFGTITSFRWSFGDGGIAEGATATHGYAAGGMYPVSLTVTNSTGFNSTASGLLEVAAPPSPPQPAPVAPPPTAPAPQAPPPPTQSANLSLSSTTLNVKGNGRTSVRLKCAGNAACSGELTLTAKQRFKKGGKNQTRTVTIASVRFTIPLGTTTVNFTVNSTGRNLLKSAHGKLGAPLKTVKSKSNPRQNFTTSVKLKLTK